MEASSAQLLFRMLKFLRPVWRTALIASLVIVVRALMEVAAVYFLSPAVTTVATVLTEETTQASVGFWAWITGSSPAAVQLRWVLAWMAAAQLGLGVAIYLRSVWDTKLSMRAVFYMRAAVYDRLQRAELSYHDRMSTGSLINRAINDLQAVRTFVNMSLLTSLDILASVSLYLGLLFLRSPWLMLAALVPVPLWSWVVASYSKRAQPLCRKQQEAGDRAMGALAENLSGVHVVRAFGAEASEIEKYRRLNGRVLSFAIQAVGLQARLTPALKIVAGLAHVGLFVFAAFLIHDGHMNVGDLMLLGAAMAAILSKLQQVNAIVEAYQKAIVSSRRLFEILDLPDAGAFSDRVAREKLAIRAGSIEFRDVSFAYGRSRALDRVTARIEGGCVTAIVGPTGSGKTTLTNLVARFYEPTSGAIWIDGQEVGSVDLCDLRRRIGIVFQETFLFSSTIRDNIRYGRDDVSDEMVQRAARIAMADEFIEKLPQGYDTLLGERGVMLSGGQKQRLALARALVYDPQILVLDDPTAALDATTEELIHDRLDPVLKGRTVILIASRLAAVRVADRVLVLEKGRITQAGTHDELVVQSGHYREIVRLQQIQEEGSSVETGAAGAAGAPGAVGVPDSPHFEREEGVG